MRTAIYTRVSTDRQTDDSQLGELRDYCQRRGWSDIAEYRDVASGARFKRDQEHQRAVEYIRQLAWYDQEVRRDDYVIGFTVFTVGARDDAEWGSFDITGILTRLARYVVTQVP